MKANVKMFEDFSSSTSTPEFREQIDPRGENGVYLSFWKEPYPLRNTTIEGGSLSWTCDLEFRSWGIEVTNFRLTSLHILLEKEDWDEETEEPQYKNKEIQVPQEHLKDLLIYKMEMEGFPIRIKSIEIDMRHSEHPEDWKYEVQIGGFED